VLPPGLIAVSPEQHKTPLVTPTTASGPTDTRPLGFGRPSEIANAVAFLLSTEARFVVEPIVAPMPDLEPMISATFC
jgi:NAD(P)-dependent dehydrogenase (short-subunit alcohol dehydrogenase family)